MKIRAASVPVLPEATIFFQIIGRRRIWITVVKGADFFRDIQQSQIVFYLRNHSKLVDTLNIRCFT